MEHLLLKAAATATTDRGEFSAIAAAYSVDRVKDRIIPGAFKSTIERWQQSGKRIPLHWNHEGDPDRIIGSVDPASMRETKQGLYVEGKVDIADSDLAKEAWRSVKNGSMSLSFGYLVDKSRKAAGGITELLGLDLFEISIVPAPANADTRVLSFKSAEDLRRATDQLERELQDDQVAKATPSDDEADDADEDPAQAVRDAIEELQEFIDGERQEGDQADVATAQRLLAALQQLLNAEEAEPAKALDPAEVDRKARRVAAEVEREDNDKRIPTDIPSAEELKAIEEAEAEPEPDPKPEPPDAREQRRKATRLAAEAEREANDRRVPNMEKAKPEFATLHITYEEMDGLADGSLKAVWSAAEVNNLPDSAFLYIESGGEKDPDGKTTPRSLRHFPYKDASGSVDLPHLRNALARIPQSNLPPSVKDQLTAKAQRILDAQKSIPNTPAPSGRDVLRERAEALELEFASDGESLRKAPREKAARKPTPELSLDELRRRTRDETLRALAGVEEL